MPSSVSSRLSNVPRRLKAVSIARPMRVCRADRPRTVAPKRVASGGRTRAMLAMAMALRSSGPGRQCSTAFSPADANGPATGSGFEYVGFDGRDLEVAKPARDVAQDVPVRVEDGHPTAGGQARVVDEVPGAGTDVEVVRTDVLPIHPHPELGRAAPDVSRDGPEDQGVVQPQQGAGVVALSPIRRVVAIHAASGLDGTSGAADGDCIVTVAHRPRLACGATWGRIALTPGASPKDRPQHDWARRGVWVDCRRRMRSAHGGSGDSASAAPAGAGWRLGVALRDRAGVRRRSRSGARGPADDRVAHVR